MPIDEDSVAAFIENELPGLDVTHAMHARFFFYDPARDTPHDRRQPFATIVTTDEHDQASDLDRPGVYRLNVGVARETYRAMFGPEPPWNGNGPVATGHDFTQLDVLLPHPVYAPLSWVCILNPSERSWPRVQQLLREAHALAEQRYRRSRRGS